MNRFLICLFAIFMVSSYAQCPKPTKIVKAQAKSRGFAINSQSRTGYLRIGEIFETVVVAQGGNDYKISIVQDDPQKGNLVYELYENVVKKTTVKGKTQYKKTKEVLFSSKEEESIEFRTDQTRKIHIKVMIEGENDDALDCVAILIETKRSAKIGF